MQGTSSRKKISYYYGWLAWSLGALFYCYEYFLRISPDVITGDLMRHYGGLSGVGLGNLVACYYYAYTPMQLPVGILMDRYRPRLLLTLASLCCALGSVLFAATNIIWVGALGRFMVGFGSAFAFVGVLKLATIWLKPGRFAMVVGMATTLGMVGGMVGQNALTYLVSTFGWQQTTYGSAIFGLFLALILWGIIRNAKPNAQIGAYEPIQFSVIFKNLYVAMRSRQVWLAGLVGGMLYIPTSVFAELWGVPYLIQGRGFTPTQASFAVSMIFLGWAIGGPITGLISDRLEQRKLPIIFGSLMAALLFSVFLFTDSIPVVVIYVLLLTFGMFSSVQNITFAIARESSADNIAGTAVAVNNMLVMFGGMLLQPFVGKMLDMQWNGVIANGHRIFDNSAYQHALLALPIGLLLAAGLVLFVKETFGKSLTDKS